MTEVVVWRSFQRAKMQVKKEPADLTASIRTSDGDGKATLIWTDMELRWSRLKRGRSRRSVVWDVMLAKQPMHFRFPINFCDEFRGIWYCMQWYSIGASQLKIAKCDEVLKLAIIFWFSGLCNGCYQMLVLRGSCVRPILMHVTTMLRIKNCY